MVKYIFYDKTLVATIENGKIVFNSLGIENSKMPQEWKPHIKYSLLNALSEGIRYETLAVLAYKNGNDTNSPIELIPYLDDLPCQFSIGDQPVFFDNCGARRYVLLPKNLPPLSSSTYSTISTVRIQSKLSPAFLHTQSETLQIGANGGEELSLQFSSVTHRHWNWMIRTWQKKF